MEPVRKVAVIGAGVMGAGIAAQVANAGLPVVLLDIVRPGDADRNAVAAGAVARLLRTEPPPFMSTEAAQLVEISNTEDDLPKLGACDWIIEAVVERLDVKQALYRRIAEFCRPGTAVSSNTSTIPIADLVRGLPADFARNFLITHFFNPPRHMRLLEVVAGEASDPQTVARISEFADIALGKTIVACKDSPGFIANRLGVYWLQLGLLEAVDAGLTVEVADAVMSKPFGIPHTGVFGLFDLTGIDLIPYVGASLKELLPEGDAFRQAYRDLPLIADMIASGHTGRKGKGGFYRLTRDGGRKILEAIDLATGAYRAAQPTDLPELAKGGGDLRALLAGSSAAARYAWRVISRTLAYAARLVPETTDEITAIDAAMRLGYNWSWGPFELADRIGVDWLIARLAADGVAVPKLLHLAAGRSFYRVEAGVRQALEGDCQYHPIGRAGGVLLLEDIRPTGALLLRNPGAALWDIGDGVACLEFTGKGNTLDAASLAMIDASVDLVGECFIALVIHNEGGHFSLGANLGQLLRWAREGAWSEIESLLGQGQTTCRALKYAPFPVIGAPADMAVSGGCEILLHCDAIQAHAETYLGLVECDIGLLPGWGGCAAMLARWQSLRRRPGEPALAPLEVFDTVSNAAVSTSAADARAKLFLRPTDRITMNRDRLLADAKARALALAPGYRPPAPVDVLLPGPSGLAVMDKAAQDLHAGGPATAHDLTVARALATVLSGGDADPTVPVSEARLLELEREQFLRLIETEPTQARIAHTLATGKTLRN